MLNFIICEGECDFCLAEIQQELNSEIKVNYPEWFETNGNLLSEYMDLYARKCRTDLARRAKQDRIWQVNCGFCEEPLGICAGHLAEVLQEIVQE